MAKFSRIDFSVSPFACIMAALALLVLPLQWILAAIAAAAFHECCHIAALFLCGVHISGFSLDSHGARIETEPMDKWKETICAIAGPAGSLLLLLPARWVPLISIFGLIQGIYNLLPVYPLDGGRVLKCMLGERAVDAVGRITVIVLIVAGCILIVRLKLGMGAMILLICLTGKLTFRKIPCKDGVQAVQWS